MSNEYRLAHGGGGKTIPQAAFFSENARHYFVPFNNQLRVYFITTRQCIKSLKFNDSNQINFNSLVSIKEDVSNPNIIWAFKEDGEVLVINWKENENALLKKLNLSKSNEDSILKIVQFNKDSIVAIIGKESAKPHTRTLVQYSLKSDDEFDEPVILSSVKNVIAYNTSNDSTKLAFLSQSKDSKLLTTIDLNDTSSIKASPFGYKTAVSSIAISNESIIAVGTVYGVIHLIYENATRLLKWHIDQVKSLCFSNDSNYLLSGGLERVLVFWQLDTEKQQFLPRLSGEIESISVQNDQYYGLSLKLDNQSNHEILVLSSLDLQSRLIVSGPRQVLNSDPSNIKKVQRVFQKQKETDISKIKYDFTSLFKIHPITKQLYFINGSTLQVFDSFKGEQSYVQKITDTLQTGKVKSETKLVDPQVKHFAFTQNGKFMITVEEHRHGDLDNLLSKNDLTYVLKVWKSTETQQHRGTQNSSPLITSHWELLTKIINPHGPSIPVLSIVEAPKSYFDGVAFITADNNGGVRLWRENEKDSSSWSLRKLKQSTGIYSNSISLTWSEDSSIILLGFDTAIIPIDIDTFEEIETPEVQVLTNIAGSRIRFLDIIDNNLIILTKTSLKSVNLLTMQENELVLKVNSPKEAEHLIAVDHSKNLISIVVNYFNIEQNKLNSKIFIFQPNSVIPIYTADYPEYISCINWNLENNFIFTDITSRIGIVTSSKLIEDSNKETDSLDYAQEMRMLLQEAQSSSKIYKQTDELENTDELNGYHKGLDINSFNGLFESIGGIKLDTLFERVVQIAN